MIGTSPSHYRIVDKLGAGVMGEVCRAEDIHLSRRVAIEVLLDEFAHDTERLTRFQREAQLASLGHPKIATLYGLEETDGEPFHTHGTRRRTYSCILAREGIAASVRGFAEQRPSHEGIGRVHHRTRGPNYSRRFPSEHSVPQVKILA
jgi:serine/threonine protein kinase